MGKVLLDILSKHQFVCSEHTKKAECFCLEKDCKLKLLCYSCIKSHDHLEQIRNIRDLFTIASCDNSSSQPMMEDFSHWLLEMSQTFQTKFGITASLIQKVTVSFDESASNPARLQALNSTAHLEHSARIELQNVYQQCRFGEVVRDGQGIDSLIECYVKVLANIESGRSQSIPVELKEKLGSIMTTMDTLNDQLKGCVELLESVDSNTRDNLKQEQVNQIPQIKRSASQEHAVKAEAHEKSGRIREKINGLQQSESNMDQPCRTVAKDSLIEEEKDNILQNDDKMDYLPKASDLNIQNERNLHFDCYSHNQLIEVSNSTNQRIEESRTSVLTSTTKTTAAQLTGTNALHSDIMHEEHPVRNHSEVLNRMSTALNQMDPKPSLEELSLVLKEATQSGMDAECYQYKELNELVYQGEKLFKKYDLVNRAYLEEAATFKNKINKTLSSITLSLPSQNATIDFNQISKNLKDLRTKVTDFVKRKLKTKEELNSIIKELQDSKFEFSREINALQNLLANAEFNLLRFMKKLEGTEGDPGKISVSQFNQSFLDLFDHPLKTEEHQKLIQQFFSIQKMKAQIIEAIQAHGRPNPIETEGAQEKDSKKENLKNLIRKMKNKKFQRIDFEAEGARLIELSKGLQKRKSGQLKENLPKDGQKKKIAEPKEKRKSKSFDTKITTETPEALSEKSLNQSEIVPEKRKSGSIRNIWGLQQISSELYGNMIGRINAAQPEKETHEMIPEPETSHNNPFMQENAFMPSQYGGANPFFNNNLNHLSQVMVDPEDLDRIRKKVKKGDTGSVTF